MGRSSIDAPVSSEPSKVSHLSIAKKKKLFLALDRVLQWGYTFLQQERSIVSILGMSTNLAFLLFFYLCRTHLREGFFRRLNSWNQNLEQEVEMSLKYQKSTPAEHDKVLVFACSQVPIQKSDDATIYFVKQLGDRLTVWYWSKQ